MAQHIALNDGILDTYPKIIDTVRSFVRASRRWNVTADGDPTDIDAMTKGKGKDKKEKGKGNDSKGHMARHCKKRINDEGAKAEQHRDNPKGNSTSVKERTAALETSTPKDHVESAPPVSVSSLLTQAQLTKAYA